MIEYTRNALNIAPLSPPFHTPAGTCFRCVMQWVLSGAGVGEVSSAGKLKDTAEAVAEEESEGYILDLRDGSDLERGSDFEAAADERRAPVKFLREGMHDV